MKNPLDQTFIHESIWFGRGLDLSHRVFVICIQQLCHNKICLTENTDGLNKEPFDRDDEKYMRISCIDKNRRQQKGEKILSFLYWIMFGKGKRIWHPSEENKLQKVLVVNLTPATLTETQFIRTKAKKNVSLKKE